MLLAGDVGGTKTLLGLFEPAWPRPRPIAIHSYPTSEFSSFTEILEAFVADLGRPLPVEAAVAGVAGPVVNQRAPLTNVGWTISAAEIAVSFPGARVRLLNDLEAMATSVGALDAAELEVLQSGEVDPLGHAAVIAAGTGLGCALLYRSGDRMTAVASEAGHADFAARTDREMALVRMLREERGRAEIEQVVSGQGLVNLHRLTHAGRACEAGIDPSSPEAPAQVSGAGLTGECAACAGALGMFVEAYGAESGNVALRGMATAGLFIGGGIAPKILPALRDGRFMRAFLDKAPMVHIVARVPVKIILNPEAGLLGAAVAAMDLLRA